MTRHQAQYWTAPCPTHGPVSTFGPYYLTTGFLSAGCLKCHFEEPCPACPPAGAPSFSEMIADGQKEP